MIKLKLNLFKKKYIAVFLIKENQTYNVIHTALFLPENPTVSYKNKAHLINIAFPTYVNGLKCYYLIEFEDLQLLITEKTNDKKSHLSNQKTIDNNDRSLMSLEVIDAILVKNIIRQLTADLTNVKLKRTALMLLAMLILGLGIGIPSGFIIGLYNPISGG